MDMVHLGMVRPLKEWVVVGDPRHILCSSHLMADLLLILDLRIRDKCQCSIMDQDIISFLRTCLRRRRDSIRRHFRIICLPTCRGRVLLPSATMVRTGMDQDRWGVPCLADRPSPEGRVDLLVRLHLAICHRVLDPKVILLVCRVRTWDPCTRRCNRSSHHSILSRFRFSRKYNIVYLGRFGKYYYSWYCCNLRWIDNTSRQYNGVWRSLRIWNFSI